MRGHIYRRGRNSWGITFDLPAVHGKRKQETITVHGTRADAERECARLLSAVHNQTYVHPSRTTVGDYLERWLEFKQSSISKKTWERYAEIAHLHLTPAFGALSLAKLHPLMIQQYYTQALAHGRRNGRGGLAPRTVLHHHRVLREALQQAVRWQLLVHNPADATEPRVPQRKQMMAYDEDQIVQLIEAAQGTPFEIPILLAGTCGMRRGEILGVAWPNIQLDQPTPSLEVVRTLEQVGNQVEFKEPKTDKARRRIDLSQDAIQGLRQHRARQAERRLRLGAAYHDRGLVCPDPMGDPWFPDRFSGAFADWMEKQSLVRARFHDLRHTHATQMLLENVHPKIVSERLGHSNIAITLDLYSHVLPGMQKAAVSKIDALLRRARALAKARPAQK